MSRAAKQTSAPKKNTGVKGFILFPLKTGKIDTRFEQGRTGLLDSEASWSRLPPGATKPEPVPCRNPEIA